MWDKRISSLKCALVCFVLSVLKSISFVFKWNRVVSMHLCPWNHMEGHWRSVFFLEKYFPSLSPLPFFNLQNLRNVLFTMNCFVGKFDKYFNVANNLHVWRPVRDLWVTEPRPRLHCQFKNRLQSNLDYPDLDYSDFFSGPNLVMNIYLSRSRSFLKLQHWKVQSNARVFCFQRAQAM